MQERLQKAAQIYPKVNVPTLSEEVLLLKAELEKPYPNTVTIANLIAHNSELLGDFLALANSNVTQHKHEIKEAKTAVNLLGLDEISNLFVSASLKKAVSQNAIEQEILAHGSKAGIAASELSFWVYEVSRSEAYMAGLMQNLGALFLSRLNPQAYILRFRQHLAHPIESLEEEAEMYGTTHVHLGALIAKKWRLDDTLCKTILMHHDTALLKTANSQNKIRQMVALIMAANFAVATADDTHITQELKQYKEMAFDALNLPENALTAASAAVVKWGHAMGTAPGGH
ncbi:HDOD domain-containing protein [Thiomicrorhabdus sp. zzn3]|uniref:HDOD domain-containing protein n=1 Tax=Thiomicrorhabdus sp. zzn3 TaxID=3039775 RepID=UPI002436D703|nr:HDOD domain-containing protein [Thiomicrorhabdus sp. zzn3]MDG6777239.1 HDOD domain-containing protein [Thiomicrorhabdus sp. zzn3]